ncbi:hypothetical protein MSG28_014625 [Choristoneura fumiferana]|uniref:Uncharacterized protein n=1 Tax=Choristoneura fumiferana TaxID=7141 RepID=A0ACC0JS75_CHOFU|nr:hypothetical protein MSG28_014625 [Choristoneura fumiferana]
MACCCFRRARTQGAGAAKAQLAMALFLKQDFSPPLLSRKWIATKFRPNVLLYSREHIISILESGLLFREDSEEVERGAPAPAQVWRRRAAARAAGSRAESAPPC